MKKRYSLIIAAVVIAVGISGCNNSIFETASENTDKSENDNQDIAVPDSEPEEVIITVSEDDEDSNQKTDDIQEDYDGEKFYDLGTELMEKVGESCFVQPILQNPTENTVTVQWFTEAPGEVNVLYLYASEEDYEKGNILREYKANTQKLSRIRGGKKDSDKDDSTIACDIYKHVVIVDELPQYHGLISERRYYRVVSDDVSSGLYTLSARALEGTPMRILLTSDHQIKDMVAANIQKVYETVGSVDAVLMNGDLVDVTDRGYDWFYADNAFFRCMTGTADDKVNGVSYKGAPLLQQAPLYTSIGNHDVMGVYDEKTSLSVQFNEPRPRWQAEEKWATADVSSSVSRERFIEDNSYNTISTEEMFENPSSASGGEKYYSVSIGDVRLISLDVSRVWRLPNIGLGGKYSEIPGYGRGDFSGGDFIFESIEEGSRQIAFLDSELSKDEYRNAKIKMVMFHSEAHSLGGNQIPAFTDPVEKRTTAPITGQSMTIYDYPIKNDYINTVIEPRLEKADTDLLFEAHSHLWNRFATGSGMNILESSNVGNNYGGYLGTKDGAEDTDNADREQYPSAFNSSDLYHSLSEEWDPDNYVLGGDPYGLKPLMPNVSSLPDNKPYLASNTITAFSILDTYKGTVDSYYFDTENPDSEVVLFDSFEL